MKLERYKDKKETRKKVILTGLTVVTIVSVAMMLYKTFANFRTSTSFSIMSGKVIYKKKGLEFGVDIPKVNSGNGLYEVSHSGASNGWDKAEYRYAGANVDNYVYFNCSDMKNQSATTCEKWRIIGLVNVETSSGTIEQRIKIVRNESIGKYSWNKTEEYDWTKSSLKDILNGIYYNRTNGTCYDFDSSNWGTKEISCNFGNNGLLTESKNMIDNDVSWPLGGSYAHSRYTSDEMYKNERGTDVYNNSEIKWTKINDSTYHNGVGLIYASELEL